MVRSTPAHGHVVASLFIAAGLLWAATGCGRIIATAVYMVKGTAEPAEYAGLEDQRVVVVCRPPTSLEFRHAGASRDLAKRVGRLLATHVKGIDLVDPIDVDDWADESDADDFRELAKAVDADMVVFVSLADFRLKNGQTLYQGNADVTVTVYDMADRGRVVWEKPLGEVLFPKHSSVPAQEESLSHFRGQFIGILAQRIARLFYEHDLHYSFAMDATAHG